MKERKKFLKGRAAPGKRAVGGKDAGHTDVLG
jgi:hypothetical protein